MNDFFKTIRKFLNEYLPSQRCLSENTIRSYRQALNLFVKFMREVKGYTVIKIQFSVISREMLLEFLDWIETERKCSARTRNQRLMVLRAFFDYAGIVDCVQTSLYTDSLNIPVKEEHGKVVEFLSEVALEALLQQPDPTKRKELRNLTFMILMYDTAARCCELLGMRIKDLRLNAEHPIAYLHGKGGKTRTVPLLPNTVHHCKRYLRKFHHGEPADSEKYVFYTVIHGTQNRMSHDNAADFIEKYGLMASQKCAEIPKHLHPHMLRHTRAIHLYHNGMPLELLSQFLGHASIDTTRIYAYADTEMKRATLEKITSKEPDTKTSIAIWENDEDMILRLSGLL